MKVELNEYQAIDYIKELQNCRHYNQDELEALYKLACYYQEELDCDYIQDLLNFGIQGISQDIDNLVKMYGYDNALELNNNITVHYFNGYYITVE